MKFRIGAILIISLVILLAIAGVVQAQSLCSLVTFSVSSGYPGDTVTVTGEASSGDTINTFWDGVSIGLPATAGPTGSYSTSFTVPAGATAGSHTVTVQIEDVEVTTDCPFNFTVVERAVAVTTTPPAAAPVRLPETGFILIPAGGLVVSGLGLLFFRQRRR